MKFLNKILIIIICILAFSNILFSQSVFVTKIFDKENNETVIGANLVLISTNDSLYKKGATSDLDGNIIIDNIDKGNYKLEISYIGYNTINSNITIDKDTFRLDDVFLETNATLLKEFVIVDKAAQVVVKEDTIEFNTVGIKVNENSVVEDLLKKLPGVEVSLDGKITVNGKEITKIRVDGKKFFEDDPEMASKNIPAEMIEKIQVIEQKSEMAQLTGFDDDESEQIINLTFKQSKKRGIFGNFSGGVGCDLDPKLRYNANGFLNLITENTQTAFTANANNINQARSTRGRGNITGGKGITVAQNFGVTNTSYINSKITMGGDLMLNHSSNKEESNTNKETFLENGSNIRNDYSNANNDLYSINGRVELSYDINPNNKLIIQPNVAYTKTLSNKSQNYEIFSNEDTLSTGYNSNESTTNKENGGLTLMFNHKSKEKNGRTFTMRIAGNASNSDKNTFNKGNNKSYITSDETLLDQKINQKEENYNTNLRLSWVEPLWNNYNLLEIAGSFKGNFSNSEKKQWDNDTNNNYSIFVEDYSNTINNMFFSETAEANYRFMQEKYNLSAGFKIEPSQTFNSVVYGDNSNRDFSNSVINYAPTFRFIYNFDKKHNIRLNYRGTTSQPSIYQLQPVKDNSNLMSENIGNPKLNPAFKHSLSLNYNKYWTEKMSSLNLSLNSSLTQNALIANSIIVANGKQYTQTVNSNKLPYNINLRFAYNTPIFNKLNFNTSTQSSYSKKYGFSEDMTLAEFDNIVDLPLGKINDINSANISEILSISYNNDYIEVIGKANYRYSNTWNNLKIKHDQTHDFTATASLIINLPLNFNINTDINYTTRSGYASFNKDEIIWNAGIEKSFLKNSLILSIKAFDILHQRQNIQQIIGDNYMQYSKSNTLQTYVMFNLTYKLSKFSGMSVNEIENNSNKKMRRERP